MRSMHTRIARVGGRLDVASRPGQTVLIATLALRPPQG
jgi:signal transduction histidine kinase